MALTQVQISGLDELNKKIAGGYTPTATDTANLDYAKKQGYTYNATPTVASATPITTPNANIPAGAVAISGSKYNTKELQQANFSNIQPIGNTLYGIPKAPIVPDIMPQSDMNRALSSEESANVGAKAQSLVGFSEQQVSDLNKAYQRQVSGTASDIDNKNLEYAKSKGWQPSTTEQVATPEPVKSTTDLLLEGYSNLATARQKAREEASKTAGLDEKSQAIATAQSLVNQLRTDILNKGILDIKEQDVRRAQPILTSQIAANLNELSREQKLDAMILQNNYNNALVEQEIAQGNYDRAREIVKETADDAYNTAKDQLDFLRFKAEIEDKAADKMTKELEYERDLALEGYVHIKSADQLKGLTEDKIYRDPVSGKIYMKPAPKIAQIVDVNGRKIGLDQYGNKIADYGSSISPDKMFELTEAGYTIDANGNLVKSSGLKNSDVSQLSNNVISGTPSWAQVLIAEKAKETGVPASLISAIIKQESGFNPDAENVSDKERSYGLGQINLNAHPQITEKQAKDPSFAVNFVAQRLKSMIDKYGLYEGIQAYNTPGAIGSDQLIRYANNVLSMAGIKTNTNTIISDRAKLVMNNPALLSNYTNTEKGKIIDELAKAGADTTSLEITALGNTAIKDISQSKDALDGLLDLSAKINDNLEYIGPIKGLAALNPWSKARQVQSDINRIRQTVGKALEGGVLRKEDEEKYKKILATITDTPSTAQYKITQLISDIKSNIINYGKGLGLSEEYVNSKLLNSSLYEQNLLGSNNIIKSTSGTTSSGIGYTIEQ